jgi:hypothetical protein
MSPELQSALTTLAIVVIGGAGAVLGQLFLNLRQTLALKAALLAERLFQEQHVDATASTLAAQTRETAAALAKQTIAEADSVRAKMAVETAKTAEALKDIHDLANANLTKSQGETKERADSLAESNKIVAELRERVGSLEARIAEKEKEPR